MTQATSKNYWISPTALYIELNALGNPDYIQASCVSGAQILVYVKDIIGYDAGHNYRRWPLQAAPTVFNTHGEKYVYAAIPRDMTLAASAWIVFPSELLDIYGKNEKEEQVGDEKYYYINLQGIIAASGDNGTEQRDWKQRISTGYLSSDEAISAIGSDTEWYKYSSVDEIVTFLKDLTMKEDVKFRHLYAKILTVVSGGSILFNGQGMVDGVASEQTPLGSVDKIATPKYINDNTLSKVKEDTAQRLIRFLEGVALGEQSEGNNLGISSDGIATLKEIVSQVFSSGALGTGFRLGTYGDTEDSYLEVDRLLVRKVAEFVKLVIRELQSVGGEMILTPASMKCTGVSLCDKNGFIVFNPLKADRYRCYFQQEVDGEAVTNDFVVDDLVRCQTFNIQEGTTSGAKNRYYWRRCIGVGEDYIDLSINDRDENSDVPQTGDEMVQLGNISDSTRQTAILLSAYGDDAPSFKMYRGINTYSLENKDVIKFSRKEVYILADKLCYRTSSGTYAGVDEQITNATKTANDAKNKADELGDSVEEVSGEVTTISNRYTSLSADVDGIKTDVKAVKTVQNSQGVTISELSARVTHTEEAITQEVTDRKEYVDGQVETLNSKITQTATDISLKVMQNVNAMNNVLTGTAFREWDSFATLKSKYPIECYDGGVGGSRYARISIVNADTEDYAGIRFGYYTLKGKKDVKFIYSVWVRVQSVVESECYIRVKNTSIVSLVPTTTVLSTTYFEGDKTSDWRLYKAEITMPYNTCYISVDIRVAGNGVIDVCRPMLNEGEYIGWSLSPNDVTESGNLEKKVKATGLDIENGKIKATADKFEVYNNNGDKTASVNANGLLEVNSGLFTGYVKKKPTVITPDNFDYYKSSRTLQQGYVEMDFEKTGSFLVFSGDLKAKLGSSYLAMTLPCTGTSWSTADYTSEEHPLAYIGQQFVVVNDSTASVTIAGGGTIRKNGSGTTGVEQNVVDKGTLAILTCSVATTYSTLGNTYKAVWDGVIYKQ